MTLPEITEIQRLEVLPGDGLAIRVAAPLSPQQAELVKARFQAALPGMPVLILPEEMTLQMVRHPSTEQIMRWFSFDHLADDKARIVSAGCFQLAHTMLETLPDGPELTAGLRKLLEAKDCFVRQALADQEDHEDP